jgi:hypothetical protein
LSTICWVLGIGEDGRRFVAALERVVNPLRQYLWSDHRLRIAKRFDDGHRGNAIFGLTGIDLGEIENIVDEGEQMLLAAPDARDILRLISIQRAANAECQQLGVSTDGVERGAKLVAHAGEKLRLCLARRPCFLFRPFSCFNVHRDAEPRVDFTRRIVTGSSARQKPAVASVVFA